jgi:hypothetical protein
MHWLHYLALGQARKDGAELKNGGHIFGTVPVGHLTMAIRGEFEKIPVKDRQWAIKIKLSSMIIKGN